MITDCEGKRYGGQLIWQEHPYFESARGRTSVLVESRPEESFSGDWVPVIRVDVYVLPSKLGEGRYDGMARDLQELSRSLLVDLYGKSRQTRDLRFSGEGRVWHSHEHELASIEKVLDQLGNVLGAIARRPASRVQSVLRQQRYWGSEQLGVQAMADLARRGISLRIVDRPVLVRSRRRMESFDVPEHRVTAALLDILGRRIGHCSNAARGHIRAIKSDQHLRHVRLSSGPTLYESVDMPKMARLQQALSKARRSSAQAVALRHLPFLDGIRPELVAVRQGIFQRNPEYKLLLQIIRQFLLENTVWYEGDDSPVVTKLTSRLFEQWSYLRIVEAFRACGLELREWTDALRQNLRSRFILDFDRGLAFEGELGQGLRLRFRYEPWILGQESAAKSGESLCRGSSADVAWCPDVVIECLRREEGGWRPAYGIVLDSKYTARLKDRHWSETSKYLSIRSTETRRQVIRQL